MVLNISCSENLANQKKQKQKKKRKTLGTIIIEEISDFP